VRRIEHARAAAPVDWDELELVGTEAEALDNFDFLLLQSSHSLSSSRLRLDRESEHHYFTKSMRQSFKP
jgi:hypothetical protein